MPLRRVGCTPKSINIIIIEDCISYDFIINPIAARYYLSQNSAATNKSLDY